MAPSFRTDPAHAFSLYRERGYHVEEDLVPPDMVARVMAVAMDQPNAGNGLFPPIPMPHRVHPVFFDLMRFPPIVAIVERLVGGKASGLGGEFFYMKPGTPGFSRHQDNCYVQAPPDSFLSVWTALTDVDADNGALTFFPGTHKLGALQTRELGQPTGPGQNPRAQAVECILPREFDGVAMEIRRGSTVFFHSQLVHASNANRSNRFRYSFLATYLLKGAPFRSGPAQQRAEVELYAEHQPALADA
jgi:ectoine hydroxylase-related dioxygenase (phytanoyl-CoA dioxygenase family)